MDPSLNLAQLFGFNFLFIDFKIQKFNLDLELPHLYIRALVQKHFKVVKDFSEIDFKILDETHLHPNQVHHYQHRAPNH